jgi:uncharacterized metal-binding protein (TIGR02443 family)
MSGLRRFIAGAVCPHCRQVDKLFVYAESGRQVCKCVNCGFHDGMDRDAAPGSAAAHRALGAGADAGAQPVRLIDPNDRSP